MDNYGGLVRDSGVSARFFDGLTLALFCPRGLVRLLVVSFGIGAALTLSMLPVSVILGTAGFWDFPVGTVPGGIVDMAQTMVGYRYFAFGPWTLPVLNIPNLVPPEGTNLVWLDAVPLLCIFGRFAMAISGTPVNLVGLFLFLCFALPGVAMTAVLWVAGQRGMIYAVTAAALADSMPFLLVEWGHIALCAQFLLILALLLYNLSLQRPGDARVSAAWIALLLITLLTSNYLFVMAGGVWFAALLQRRLSRRVSRGHFAVEAVTVIAIVASSAAATGILSADLRFGGTFDFGFFSMNLGSPFAPQMSGVLPPFSTYLIGRRSQVLDYMGIGALLIAVAALPALLWWLRRGVKSHLVLLIVFGGFFLFALSNTVTLGSHTLVHIPLPEAVAYWFGAFRASGRFFWPIGYSIVFVGMLGVSRSFRPRAALAILSIASVLQVMDTLPQRREIAVSTGRAAPAVVDRIQVADVLARSRRVMMFPTYRCARAAIGGGEAAEVQVARLEQASVEIQMLAALRNLPINSAITDRLRTDCTAENAIRRLTLEPDVAYFYLSGAPPGADQVGGRDPAEVCRVIEWISYCRLPSDAAGNALAAPL